MASSRILSTLQVSSCPPMTQFHAAFYLLNIEPSEIYHNNNGVVKGKVLAGLAYYLYCYDLFDVLERSGYRLWIKGVYVGAIAFSNDDLLLAPSFSALQEMIKITDNYWGPTAKAN